jgi:hypothetical protein
MKHRKLRIAWSVAWGIVAVLLIVSWARSYWWIEAIRLPYMGHGAVQVVSIPGLLAIGSFDSRVGPGLFHQRVVDWRDLYARAEPPLPELPSPLFGGVLRIKSLAQIFIPYWCLTIAATASGSLPWLRWRFSLRTLLIATTLVSVGLGLIVWAAH